MNLREDILREHSRQQCDKIVAWVGKSKKRFAQLFYLFINDMEYRVVQRAAWPVSYCVETHPGLIQPHFGELVAKLQQPGNHDAIKRNSARLLQHVAIPEQWQGEIMNICFDYIASPKEAVAIKAFSITVLGKMANNYPEIIPELKMIIEDQYAHQTAAFTSRAKKLFKDLGIDQ
ncbi:MAG: hypothetical protein EOP53_09810 [Sphingobacteriales bacterium]|nr:MAG: hypothetical protein EOP53_09810 [Sphingobacteriales bacterium]